jgi:hypothetical protein
MGAQLAGLGLELVRPGEGVFCNPRCRRRVLLLMECHGEYIPAHRQS